MLVGIQTDITMEITVEVLKKKTIDLSHNLATVLLGMDPKCSTSCLRQRYLLIAILFIIVRSWKQPRGLSTDKQMMKMRHVHTMEYHSAIKKNKSVKLEKRNHPE